MIKKDQKDFIDREAVARRCSENTCAHSRFFNKVAGFSLQLYQKRDSGTGVFL